VRLLERFWGKSDVGEATVLALERRIVTRPQFLEGADVLVANGTAFVVGGRVLGAIERRAVGGDWRTNVSRGGSARSFELSPEWASLAVRAAAAVGADYAGVDLLPSRSGEVFVLELNGVPGWQGLQRATGIDVAGAVVDHLMERVRAPRAAVVHSA